MHTYKYLSVFWQVMHPFALELLDFNLNYTKFINNLTTVLWTRLYMIFDFKVDSTSFLKITYKEHIFNKKIFSDTSCEIRMFNITPAQCDTCIKCISAAMESVIFMKFNYLVDVLYSKVSLKWEFMLKSDSNSHFSWYTL